MEMFLNQMVLEFRVEKWTLCLLLQFSVQEMDVAVVQ